MLYEQLPRVRSLDQEIRFKGPDLARKVSWHKGDALNVAVPAIEKSYEIAWAKQHQ